MQRSFIIPDYQYIRSFSIFRFLISLDSLVLDESTMSNVVTFPMPRESESASRLRAIISDMLPLFSADSSDGDLAEYITVIVCNGKTQVQAREYLNAFLGEQSVEFVTCLWEILMKDFTPKTAVDFGFHDDTLIKQGSCSRRDNDYDQNFTKENRILVNGTPEAHVSPKARSMKMLRRELINSPCKRVKTKEKKCDWDLSGVNYSRKVLRSIVVPADKKQHGMYSDNYEKSMDERIGILKDLPHTYSRTVPRGRAASARSNDRALQQELKPHVSVWDRLDRASPKRFLLYKEDENKVLEQYEHPQYNEQHNEASQREVTGYRHRYFQSYNTKQRKSGMITCAYNLSRKRRYGIINSPSSEDDSVGEYKQAKEENPSLLSYQSAKPDIYSEILAMKQTMQKLEIKINQAKQLKKQKVGDVKCSPQSGEVETQDQQEDATESRTIHVTNVYYGASKEAISMLFSKCGPVKDVTVVTDPVTSHPLGAAFVTFDTKESVNKAIALSDTVFYSRPIKVSFVEDLSRFGVTRDNFSRC